ncbi:MAG: NUDIX domain-containing protein [Bacteroidetes bacterium]|nr:NUDIX domain-containing protein [Bacteroidota bacterium]
MLPNNHNRFNVRVYGVLIHQNKILVSDEYIKKNFITKFPGGGLEFGEGTVECVKREFKEELNIDIEVINHFYTTDFFVASAFNSNSQVISIYYVVKTKQSLSAIISNKKFNFELKEGAQSFRFIDLDKLKEADFTLIIDRRVAELLIEQQHLLS